MLRQPKYVHGKEKSMSNLLRQLMVVAVIAGFVFAMPLVSSGSPIVYSAAGADPASIQATVDTFRTALGVNNGNAPGPLATGFREINWDGGGSTATALAGTPFAGFKDNRGALFTTPGTGFVQATPAGLGTTFNNNPTYATLFQTFSSPRLFSPIGSNITDVHFFVPGPGTTTTGTTSAFGAVFANVRLVNTTSIELFNKIGGSLGTFSAPIASAGLSFLGVQFNAGEEVSRVRLITGNSALGPNDGGSVNVVAMDNFIHGETRSVPEPGTALTLGVGLLTLAAWRRYRQP
jgi:PEP-CTERM motif